MAKKKKNPTWDDICARRKPMEGMTRWQDTARRKSCHSGYSDVSYEDTWSLDTRLAQIIANHLRAFLKAEKGPNGGYPYEYGEKYGQENAFKEWLNALRKMIFAFEEYYNMKTKVPEMEYDEEFEDYMTVEEDPDKVAEVKARIRSGMQLFIDNFEDLWI